MFLTYTSSIYLSPVIGNFIDGFLKNKIIAASNFFLGFLLFLYLFAFSADNAYLMLFFVFFASLVTTAISLSLTSSVSSLFHREDLTRVNGLVGIIENSPLIAGPAIGAMLYSTRAIDWAIYIAVAVTISVGFIFYRQDWSHVPRKNYKFFGGDLLSGFNFIKTRKDLLFLQLLFSSYNFFSGISASVVIIYIIDFPSIWGGEWNLATNNTLSGIGIILGGVLVALWAGKVRRKTLVVGSMFASSIVSRILIPFIPNIYTLLTVFLLRSVLVQFSNVPLTTIWQERVPAKKQGSVFGARRFLGQGPYPLAVLLGGSLATIFGSEAIVYILLISGILEFLCAVALIFSPARKVFN